MSQLSFEDLVNGTVPDASDFNSRFNALKNRINNGMESDNISDNSITTGKINNDAVTLGKLAHGTLGGIPYYAAAGAPAELAGNTTTTRKYLSQVGNGSVSAVPSWEEVIGVGGYTTVSDTSTSDESRTTASYADTTLSLTFTPTKEAIAFVDFSGLFDITSSAIASVALLVDGTIKHEVGGQEGSGNSKVPVSMFWSGELSAAEHIVKIQIKGDGTSACALLGTSITSRLNASYYGA